MKRWLFVLLVVALSLLSVSLALAQKLLRQLDKAQAYLDRGKVEEAIDKLHEISLNHLGVDLFDRNVTSVFEPQFEMALIAGQGVGTQPFGGFVLQKAWDGS